MATPDVIQLEALLAPIAGDKPTGPDLRADANPASDYFKLKDSQSFEYNPTMSAIDITNQKPPASGSLPPTIRGMR